MVTLDEFFPLPVVTSLLLLLLDVLLVVSPSAGKSKFAPTCDPKPGGGAEADLVGADAAANPGGGGLENPGGGGFAGC